MIEDVFVAGRLAGGQFEVHPRSRVFSNSAAAQRFVDDELGRHYPSGWAVYRLGYVTPVD